MFIDLGAHYEEGFITLNDIANRKDVFKKFLEQIIILYKKSGLLLVSRGNQGGYRLAKKTDQITLKDIIEISENSLFEEQTEGNLINDILKGMDNKTGKFCLLYLLNFLKNTKLLKGF